MTSQGMVLITGLLLLAAISLLALAGTSGMILQKHMATNFSLDSAALQHAEIAQLEAQSWLLSRPSFERENDCTADCLLPGGIHRDQDIPYFAEFESTAWWNLNATKAGQHPETGEWLTPHGLAEEDRPHWVMEELHFQPLSLDPPFAGTTGVGYYRILGRGSGGNSRSVAVTEAIIARPWGEGIQPADYPTTHDNDDFCFQWAEVSHPQLQCGLQSWRQRR